MASLFRWHTSLKRNKVWHLYLFKPCQICLNVWAESKEEKIQRIEENSLIILRILELGEPSIMNLRMPCHGFPISWPWVFTENDQKILMALHGKRWNPEMLSKKSFKGIFSPSTEHSNKFDSPGTEISHKGSHDINKLQQKPSEWISGFSFRSSLNTELFK